MNEYLRLIKNKVDDLILKTGFGELTVKIEVKNGKVLYIVFINSEERFKINA